MLHEKRIALVTGGNRGIGYELVKQLSLNGFKVILTSRDPEKGHRVTQKFNDFNLDVSFIEMDVNNQESINNTAGIVNKMYGRLDVLINNAGVIFHEDEDLLKMEPTILEKTMKTNFFGAYHVIRTFIPIMEQQGYGRIINGSSEYGEMSEMAYPKVGAYKLSKLALNGLTRLLAAESKGDIKINAVDPGWVSTDMGGPSAPRTPEQAAKSIIWLATIGSEGPNGGFFRDGIRIDW
ncbi:SDR family NAD(P)-dependent oxidoreductase [Gottfriedia acidiceleris]|uniref:SDR family NAD(P)-dependent oxidoreductase n=1 Tax=Gottfriedia acidiceleris TaxID=371036 RepID=UPI003D1EBC45